MLSKTMTSPVLKFVRALFVMSIVLVGFMLAFENIPVLARYQHYIIVTDSMEPTINVGDVVFVNKNSTPDVGDIIAFDVTINNQDIVVVHYLAEQENGVYRTRPEGTSSLDTWILQEDAIIGVYSTRVPFIGRFLLFAQSPIGKLVILVDILVVYFIYKLLWKK